MTPPQPKDVHVLTPNTCEGHLPGSGLCSAGVAKDLKSEIIRMTGGSKGTIGIPKRGSSCPEGRRRYDNRSKRRSFETHWKVPQLWL